MSISRNERIYRCCIWALEENRYDANIKNKRWAGADTVQELQILLRQIMHCS